MKSLITILFSAALLLVLSCGNSTKTETKTIAKAPQKQNDSLKYFCRQFDSINSLVRDCEIDAPKAKSEFAKIIAKIRMQSEKAGLAKHLKSEWVFPVKGYNSNNIGGTHGEGYVVGNYDYFAGTKHTGHPSQDIFIFDKDQNILDDKTNKPVDVLSLTGGVVIASQSTWDPTETRRGGIYLWIYDNATDAIVYYAHNSKILVTTGDTVYPGMKIGEVGRSGLNAYKKRSPTHLHISYLKVSTNLPVPEDLYKNLKTAKLIK
jgi:peptidoglycan LD-endopeptidase LytH